MTTVVYQIEGGDFEHGGEASRRLKEQLKRLGADPAVVRRAMIAAYEAEMNVVIHAVRGELRASLQNGQLDIEVSDTGPGIPDIAAALREGFSTASARARELGFGAGMGLPNIRRNSDEFAIESTAGQGTRVRFSIRLRPQTLYGTGRHGLTIEADRCRRSLRCVHACPTHAVRVLGRRPEILDYLCIDCTACVAVCPTGTLTTRGTRAGLPAGEDAVVVVPAALLVQFGSGIAPAQVRAALAALLGGEAAAPSARVWVLEAWEAALRAGVRHYAETAAALPVISPACPAAVNLIETRYPALIPHVAPLAPAVEAVRAALAGQRAVFVVTCPSQRTALLGDAAGGPPLVDVLLPAAVQAALAPHLPAAAARPAVGGTVPPPPDADLLRVTGLPHLLHLFDEIEGRRVRDVRVVEPWACAEGCFGSPLLREEPCLARHRWETAPLPADGAARAVPRVRPLAPRPGLRLDADMGKAIQKLARIDTLRRELPGADCGECGAPTCAALAEDIVLGRAAAGACVRQRPQEKAP